MDPTCLVLPVQAGGDGVIVHFRHNFGLINSNQSSLERHSLVAEHARPFVAKTVTDIRMAPLSRMPLKRKSTGFHEHNSESNVSSVASSGGIRIQKNIFFIGKHFVFVFVFLHITESNELDVVDFF